MRPDLFLRSAVRYTVPLTQAPLLFAILQEKELLPQALKRRKKGGKICFFLFLKKESYLPTLKSERYHV